MAAYAGVWLIGYVIAFPLFILYKLWTYRDSPTVKRAESEVVDLRFLLHDYKATVPLLLWESIEMLRKLLLSTIGAFWSDKSTISIAIAMLISGFFLFLHGVYQPFKADLLNRVQTLSLTTLTLFYLVSRRQV
jgi:hypothetical protein